MHCSRLSRICGVLSTLKRTSSRRSSIGVIIDFSPQKQYHPDPVHPSCKMCHPQNLVILSVNCVILSVAKDLFLSQLVCMHSLSKLEKECSSCLPPIAHQG